jgi:hypothetical protein
MIRAHRVHFRVLPAGRVPSFKAPGRMLMKRLRWTSSVVVAFAAALVFTGGIASGCGSSGSSSPGGGGSSGAGGSSGSGGTAGTGGGIAGTGGGVLPDSGTNACGNNDPTCDVESVGPTADPPSQFPLPSDDPAPDNVEADGVTRDEDGFISLDASKAQFDFLWIANDLNYGVGTVSKVQTTPFPTAPTYREAARYATVTCMSNDTGSNEGVLFGRDPRLLCAGRGNARRQRGASARAVGQQSTFPNCCGHQR